MNKELSKKFNDQSVENSVIDFLKKFSKLKGNYAFTGGIAFGGYLGHLPRRSGDIDMVATKQTYPLIRKFLENNGFREKNVNKIVKTFYRKGMYFHIDIHIDYLYLANPKTWRIIDKYSLSDAVKKRNRAKIKSIDGKKEVNIYVVPSDYHFLMKLFPPLEPSNAHDLLYLILSKNGGKKLLTRVKNIIENDIKYRQYFIKRIIQYKNLMHKTIWYYNLSSIGKKRLISFFDGLL